MSTKIAIIKPRSGEFGIVKSPKHNSFYLTTTHGKVFLYKNGKFTKRLNNWHDKDEKEDYIEAIEGYLGEKQKVNFTLYTFAAEDADEDGNVKKDKAVYYETLNNIDFRVIRKHNITTYVTKTKIEKLKGYNVEKSTLQEAHVVPRDGSIMKMVEGTPSYDSLSAIESLIGYFKILDFHVLSTDGGFSLRTTPLKTQIDFIEPKINHDFIEYSAKTIKELQNHNLTEYLMNNFQSESCVYTTLIKLYQKHFKLTYQSLFNYFHQEDLNQVGIICDATGKFSYNSKSIFQNGEFTSYFKKISKKNQAEFKKLIESKTNTSDKNYSLSVEQLKKFFIDYNLKMTILDIHGNIIDKHHPTKDGKASKRSNLSTRQDRKSVV